jgi:hypothetical protein
LRHDGREKLATRKKSATVYLREGSREQVSSFRIGSSGYAAEGKKGIEYLLGRQ